MTERVIVEIRAAEGGADAKDLVPEQFAIYASYAKLLGLKYEILDDRAAMLVFEVEGKGAEKAFAQESGGHRWQRVPPTEKSGRRHTSTVTVAVMPVRDQVVAEISESDIEWQATRGGGSGGQARNKTSNCVQMRHRPTGIQVRVESARSQLLNREQAFRLLGARILAEQSLVSETAERLERRRQVGSGQRGDKIRTIRLQDGQVTDHRSGKRISTARYFRGHIKELVG